MRWCLGYECLELGIFGEALFTSGYSMDRVVICYSICIVCKENVCTHCVNMSSMNEAGPLMPRLGPCLLILICNLSRQLGT